MFQGFPPGGPGKRKAVEMQPGSEIHEDQGSPKRQRSYISPQASVSLWLERVPPRRRHSDSSVPSEIRSVAKAQDQLPSPASMQPMPPPPIPLAGSSPREFIAVSQGSQITASTPTTITRNRVRDPAYREELRNHGIYIRAWERSMPDDVKNLIEDIIGKERTSPRLNAASTLDIQDILAELEDEEEETSKLAIINSPLLPQEKNYANLLRESKIAIGKGLAFDRTALPRSSVLSYRPIVQPWPDWFVGYSESSFGRSDSPEQIAQYNERIRVYAHPTSKTARWPWLAIEFKAPSRGGTPWVAENQNAGTGAHIVNSIRALNGFAGSSSAAEMVDPIAFSVVVVPRDASLWCHWRDDTENDYPRYVSSRFRSYLFDREDELRDFRAHVRNIVDWGLGPRLSTIKDALLRVHPRVAQWDAEDAEARKRRRRPSSQVFEDDDGPMQPSPSS